MKPTKPLLLLIIFAALFSGCSWFTRPAKNIQLITLFNDHMVLQRDQEVPVWGKANAGGIVTVEIKDQRKQTQVKEDGSWMVRLAPLSAGGPYQLRVIGADTIRFNDVMVGEVWVCSGQSNMEMPLAGWGQVLNYEQEIRDALYPDIRLFQVKHTISRTPLDTINCPGWSACGPETIPQFSAVAYFFGRELYKTLAVPIGLVHTSWGGTLAEAWTSEASLNTMPYFQEQIAQMDSTHIRSQAEYDSIMANRKAQVAAGDSGFQDGRPVWNEMSCDRSQWRTMNLPTRWEKAGYPKLDGVVWFSKEFTLPRSMQRSPLTLHLGPINDNDVTWVNGVAVGGLQDANAVRTYPIPAAAIQQGVNRIVVRVEDIGGTGGIWGEAKQMYLESNEGEKISLAGAWRYKIGFDTNVLGPEPLSPNNPNRPMVLYNAMLRPLMPFAIRGAIWYQGESNASRAFQYRTLFPLMIQDWRKNWGQGDFPFLFVQLANFMKEQTEPTDDSWAELREAQLMTLSLPNTGMALAIDIGDAQDIHPKNKQEVGRRLALNALKLVYDKPVEHSGPLYRSMTPEGNSIRLHFNHTAGGLTAKNGRMLQGFTLAGEDRKFVWADARIEGETVVVSHPRIHQPMAVRYAWAANPIGNLYNQAGLPASPFRTDSWPGITEQQ